VTARLLTACYSARADTYVKIGEPVV